MNRNALFLMIGLLVVATGVLGYRLYDERQRSGIDINIGGHGVSIRER